MTEKRTPNWILITLPPLFVIVGGCTILFLFFGGLPIPGDFRTPETYKQWLSEGHDPTEILVQAAGLPEIRELALAEGAGVDTALILYLRRGGDDVSTIKWFIKHDALAKEEDVNMALLSCLRWRDPSIRAANLLLDQGADVNYISEGRIPNERSFALLVAAKYCDHKVVKFLISNGADVNLLSGGDWTPLMRAAQCEEIDVAEELIANGVDVNVKVRIGKTALQIATEAGNERMIKLLRGAGAKE